MLTASFDKTARVWTVLLGSDSPEGANLMADFAEALCGYKANEFGSAVPLEDQMERLDLLRKRLAQAPDREGTLTWYLRRFLGIQKTSQP